MDAQLLIEKISEHHVLQIMEDLGADFNPHRTTNDQMWFTTICHHGKKEKLCYFRDSKEFYCYTECGKLSLYDLLMSSKGINFPEAMELIQHYAGINKRVGIDEPVQQTYKDAKKVKKYISLRNNKTKRLDIEHLLEIPNPNIINYFNPDSFYYEWINEGMSGESMRHFDIRWYATENFVIIPHKNIKGQIVGIRRRSFAEEDRDYKYMPFKFQGYEYTHPLNLNFYGLYEHLQGIKKFKKVVIVESEKSVIKAHEFYGGDAFVIATCGFNISPWHRKILQLLGVEEVILGFDKDFDITEFEKDDIDTSTKEYKAYTRFINRIKRMALDLAPYFNTYILWDREGLLDIKDAPFDKGKQTLEKLMKSKERVSLSDILKEDD